jgi:hypothetical protein
VFLSHDSRFPFLPLNTRVNTPKEQAWTYEDYIYETPNCNIFWLCTFLASFAVNLDLDASLVVGIGKITAKEVKYR